MRVLLAVSILLRLGVVRGAPPNIPGPDDAQQQLDDLTVGKSLSGSGYSRDRFDHWHTVKDACNTREIVLQRDGKNVVTDSACRATSGTWFSPYDGATWTQASDVDIDHMVPLKNAWISGAREWNDNDREAFANDLERPQLWAVTDNVNQEKSDRNPSQWKPPLESFYCDYASSWINVKYYYNLTVTTPEKQALQDMVDTCGDSASSGSGSSGSTNGTADGAASRAGASFGALLMSLGTFALLL